MMIRLVISNSEGERIDELSVMDDSTVIQVKEKIAEVSKTESGMINLIFSGKVLCNEHTLRHYSIVDGSSVILVMKKWPDSKSCLSRSVSWTSPLSSSMADNTVSGWLVDVRLAKDEWNPKRRYALLDDWETTLSKEPERTEVFRTKTPAIPASPSDSQLPGLVPYRRVPPKGSGAKGDPPDLRAHTMINR